jgi:hypothetical protein
MRTPDRVIGFESTVLTLCLGDTWSVTCDAGHLSGHAAASLVDDRHETRAMMRGILFAIMRCRS